MALINRKVTSTKKPIIIMLAIVATIIFFTFYVLFDPDIESNKNRFSRKQPVLQIYPNVYNSTHLWSLRLADENYFRLARLLPCRTVEYKGRSEFDKINSCDHSESNEFSIQNTLQAQKWLYEHQHPANCTNKRFAIIQKFAWSGFGSSIHQVVWAFGVAIAQNRIAVYNAPEKWLYADCDLGNPDCLFLPISNCSLPSKVDDRQIIYSNANIIYWAKPILPPVFQNRSFNWYRAQLLFYLMRYKPETLAHAHNTIAQYFKPPSIDLHHPYIAIYVRRSDKVKSKEMSQAYSLQQYFDLFDDDARRANITSVYINSEDAQVFKEFVQINKEKQNYYKLLSVKRTKNVVFTSLSAMSTKRRAKIVLEFLTDYFIEINADLHVGTLTSNSCRLIDAMRLVLGKIIPYYTPEDEHLMDIGK